MTSTFYPPYHLGGDAVHVEYLARQLVKMGHEVHVFHSLDAYLMKRRQFPEISESNGVCLHTFRTHLGASPYAAYLLGNSPSVIKRFRTLVKELRPDVVHHHNISLMGYAILEKRQPYVNLYTAHDFWLICQLHHMQRNKDCKDSSCGLCAIRSRRPPQIWRHFAGFKKAIQNIDLLIAPSNFLRRKLGQSIIARSLTLANFAPFPPSNIPEAPYSNFFLFVGRLEHDKGILNLIEVLAAIMKKKRIKLVIAGEGSLKDHIEHFARENSLKGLISCVGFVRGSDLYSLYNGARALISPSVGPENSPLVALEALSVGTPVIASNVGGLLEIVSKVDRRLIFNSSTELEGILTDFSEYKFTRRRIKEIYDLNFSPRVYVDHYLEAIRGICS
jgi:glycosyltransferase involved in cell wall biosynthesis